MNDAMGHMVFFKLKEGAKPDDLVAACNKYLSGHPGVLHFSAGVLAQDLTREANDRDWDVALHLVFRSRADHDAYQEAPRHKQFLAENKMNWQRVRVFDSV